MGQPLTGNSVQSTYDGLLKTTSNAPLPVGGVEIISDGLGNDSALELGQSQARLKGEYVEIVTSTGLSGIVADDNIGDQINYFGDHDFSNATVTGLPGGGGGLVNGSGVSSLKNEDSLVTTPSTAQGTNSISLGTGNSNYANYSIQIGSGLDNADSSRVNSILIGNNVKAAQYAIVIGNNSNNYAAADAIQIGNDHSATNGNYSVNIGNSNYIQNGAVEQIVIGKSNTSGAQRNIVIGGGNAAGLDGTIMIGEGNTTSSTGRNHGIGYQTVTTGTGEDKMAYGTLASATADRAVAIGRGAVASHTNSVALGTEVTSKSANTTHVKGLNIDTCPEYAGNAEAVSAGLPLGQIYRTGDLLKIVHA